MADNRFALVVGSSRYDDPGLAQLVAPGNDVPALAAVLADPAIGGFAVTTLLDRPAAEVGEAIELFFGDRKQDDLLLLYFTGHGIKDASGQLYFAMTNTKRKALRTTAVPAQLVNEVMASSGSKKQLLILDCCHSGAFARGMVHKSDGSVGLEDIFQGRAVLTASNALQYSFEGDDVAGQGKRSIFTHYLVQGLQSGEADQDRDGRITLDELFDYVSQRVRSERPEQTPTQWMVNVQGKFVIARAPSGGAVAVPPPVRAPLPPAIAAPAPTRPEVRRLLNQALVSDADFNAFCLDYFPDVHRRFGGGMDRLQKTNLLLEQVRDLAAVVRGLREAHPDQVP